MSFKRLSVKRNSGFTLVELIIVIAIIAILSAVTAPQYIKYVEKSKVAADMDTAAAIQSVIITLCTDGTITADNAAYVTWDTATGLTGDGQAAVEAVTGTIPAAKSNKAKAADVVYSVDFTPEGTPIVTTSVDFRAWDD